MRNLHSSAGLVGPAPRAGTPRRILLVANRLPVTARMDGGELRLHRSDGGLAAGLRAVHARSEAIWIGWSGMAQGASAAQHRAVARCLSETRAWPVALSEDEIAGFYRGYSNGALWPVLHDGIRDPAAAPGDWDRYRAVNQRYAETIARHLRPGDRVWIHDYHLMLVPGLLRDRCPGARIGFFLHTPFPPPEIFARLPQAPDLLRGLLGANLIGVHTRDYCRNFTAAVHAALGYATTADEIQVEGRRATVFACPMGIDVRFFSAWALTPAVTQAAARIRGDGGPLFVGVDRLDYTKGIVQRLTAFDRLLELEPGLRGRARFIQVAVPSRPDVNGYGETRCAVEALVARINHRHGLPGWTPVLYRYRSVDTGTLVALYRAADVMVVTPVCDGMNLVAKEFVASRNDGDGVLVLSSRAGAAQELRAAVLVDPCDPDRLVAAYQAAVEMSPAERRVRMRRLRLAVDVNDVRQWSKRFLDALDAPEWGRAAGRPGRPGRPGPRAGRSALFRSV